MSQIRFLGTGNAGAGVRSPQSGLCNWVEGHCTEVPRRLADRRRDHYPARQLGENLGLRDAEWCHRREGQ